MKYFIGISIFLAFGFIGLKYPDPGEIEHQVSVLHPGINLTDSVEKTLFEVLPSDTNPHEYYMKVKTVVCGDDQCRIDIVRIYWDELGHYNRLYLPNDVFLEKAEGAHFSKEDYQKLDRILSNVDASLRDVYKYQVVGSESSDGIDGVTGATILLHTQDYVQGAVWTCYTLWHWANGGISDEIRNITGHGLSSQELLRTVHSTDERYQIFAFEQMHKKALYPEDIPSQLTDRIIENPRLLAVGLTYFLQAERAVFENETLRLMRALIKSIASCVSMPILNYDAVLTQEFITDVTHQVSMKGDFEEINVLLKILDQKNNGLSSEVMSSLTKVLNGPNFLSARIVYWFLSERSLPSDQKKEFNAFKSKNLHRL